MVTWQQSNINWQGQSQTNPQMIRGGYITRNGQYAIFSVGIPQPEGQENILVSGWGC